MVNTLEMKNDAFDLFFQHHMDFHDAEIICFQVTGGGSVLEVDLQGLCIIDPKSNWWRVTDTKVKLLFYGVTKLEIELFTEKKGGFLGASVELFEWKNKADILIVGTDGVAKVRFDGFTATAIYCSEPRPEDTIG